MIRPFNPFTYLGYLFSAPKRRTRKIFNLLRGDDKCSLILNRLEEYGYRISYPLFGGGGLYKSQTLSISGDAKEEFLKRHKNGDFIAKFELSPRYGFGQNAFYFIHELIHFEQDLKGHLQSRDILTNECEAAIEAIKAAHRLGGIVWEGALSSFDWGAFAKNFELEQDEESLKARWHKKFAKSYGAKTHEGISAAHYWAQHI